MDPSRRSQPVRIRLSDPQQLPLLCDYFRRLGANTQPKPGLALSVEFSDSLDATLERDEIKTFLDAWTTRNASNAELID